MHPVGTSDCEFAITNNIDLTFLKKVFMMYVNI